MKFLTAVKHQYVLFQNITLNEKTVSMKFRKTSQERRLHANIKNFTG